MYCHGLDYGGYGIGKSSKGRAYNVHGQRGVKLWFDSDLPFLDGSQ